MPLWGRLHAELKFIADELHQRSILLFDHHSSVLTHRPRNEAEMRNIWARNRHHVPFYPSPAEAATWQFHGSRFNDWRMLDLESGQPVYLPDYNAEQFCMNHPQFRAAYAQYLKHLIAETGVDGLMSDDNIFYGGWHACACEHCRNRFRQEYGQKLPPVTDDGFWGNRRNDAFKDWVALRFRSSGDFLEVVKNALPPGLPLLTCCASSDSQSLPGYGMSYEDFIPHCKAVLLEMVGSTPTSAGTWDDRIPSQLLHLGIARDHHVPCLGLGYGFYPDTAFFIWAVNKFLGSDSWFSTLKGRLNASPGELAALADDADLVGEPYRWEKAHPDLFTGEVETDLAIFFSRASRDNYGQVPGDYVADYTATCLRLTRASLSPEVVTRIPDFGSFRVLVLSSVVCLSGEQRVQLGRFIQAGGTVIATGPTGHYDERANPGLKPWLADFGILEELKEPDRPGGFPPYQGLKAPVELAEVILPDSAKARLREGWIEVNHGAGRLLWRPERFSLSDTANSAVAILQSRNHFPLRLTGLPGDWVTRHFRSAHSFLIHALPIKVATVMHATLKNQISHEAVVERLHFKDQDLELSVESQSAIQRVLLHSPDLVKPCVGRLQREGKWQVRATNIRRYFVLEVQTLSAAGNDQPGVDYPHSLTCQPAIL